MTSRAASRLPRLPGSVVDVAHLLRFRAATVRRPRRLVAAAIVLGGLTVAPAVVPAVTGAPASVADPERWLAAALAAIVFVSVAGAVATGGGREILGRDASAIHPISPVTDHLAALVLAPLNSAWLIQTWSALALAAMAAAPGGGVAVVAGQAVALTWVLMATALGQVVGWAVEWTRRGPRGVAVVRVGVGVVLVTGAVLGALPDLRHLLVGGPARWTAAAISDGGPGTVAVASAMTLAVLGVVTGVLVLVGGRLAVRTALRMPRSEGRLETRTHPARAVPRSDLAMLRRIDRASVWRSLPLRRGIYLLAIAPGLVALAGALPWDVLVLMPGLVASGTVLLFGVNMWCLDGRGMLWRETLPVAPRTVLTARLWVQLEILVGAAVLTLALGAVRAGRPTVADLVAVGLTMATVLGQALSASLRWSMANPHAADLRSARATPAPPAAMVGYSMRLALVTTLTGMAFSTFAVVERIDLMLPLAAALLLVSSLRLWRAGRRWLDPVQRARVVGVVAA